MATMQAWRQNRLYRRTRTRGPAKTRGTLAADAERYYREIGHLASWRERRSEIRAWVALYGPQQRYRLTPAQVTSARRTWLAAGVKPKTINHRVDALRHLFRTFRDRETPCDEIDPLPVPKQPIRTVEVETIRAVYRGLLAGEQRGTLRTAKTRARFAILASCGVRPSELMRAQPSDVDLDRRIWRTRDGKGGQRPGGLYLYDDLLFAWTLFIQADAWGPFETSAFARTLREAGWPADMRPYALRASVGVELSDRGADFADVAAMLGHTRPDTTRTHYVPIRGGRMQAAGERLSGRLAWHSIVAPGETGRKSSGD
jgi:integrase